MKFGSMTMEEFRRACAEEGAKARTKKIEPWLAGDRVKKTRDGKQVFARVVIADHERRIRLRFNSCRMTWQRKTQAEWEAEGWSFYDHGKDEDEGGQT